MSGYKFGPFDLDVEGGELRKHGTRLRIQKQPFQVLVTLVERAGTVVSREDLRKAVWAGDTFVDFEHGLNAAVNKVRQALGDSSEHANYIETIPGQGYRFVAPAEKHPAKKNTEQPRAKSNISKLWKTTFPAVAAVLVLVTAGYFYFHRSRGLTDKDTIVLADFINTTGDSVFDGALRQGLAVQLDQSPFLRLVSDERIQQTLRLMGRSPDVQLTAELAREVCERTSSAAVLEGSIASLGTQYVLWLRAKTCRTGEILDQEQVQAARKEDVLNALSEIARKFRTRVGESRITVEQYDTPLAAATTPSLEALKAFSESWKVLSLKGEMGSIPLLRRAIEIDPRFAMAHAQLGREQADIGESALSAESSTEAYRLRDRVSDREKFYISASYQMQVTGNLEEARQTCELWAQTYPREVNDAMNPHGFLAGIIYPPLAKYDKAIEEAKKLIEIDPDFVIGYIVLAYNYQYVGQLREAENALDRAAKRNLERADSLVLRFDIAFLKDDMAEMERTAGLARGKSGAEDWLSYLEGSALAYSGHLQEAKQKSQHAVALALQSGQRERAALWETGPALWEAFFGKASDARRSALAALELSKGRDVEYGGAFALALARDSMHSQDLADDLEKRFPEDTAVKSSYMSALRALLALDHGNESKATELLQLALPTELGAPPSSFLGFFGSLYPIYVRGQAYLAAHRGSDAAVEFQKILDHRGVVVSDPIGALAHLQLGRAFALSGDKTKAKKAYQDFLLLWKDADPDIPILTLAKAEYAKLR